MTSFKTLLNGIRAGLDGLSAKLSRLKARVLHLETWAGKFEWVPSKETVSPVLGQNVLTLSQSDTSATGKEIISAVTDEEEFSLFGKMRLTPDDSYLVIWDGKKYPCTLKLSKPKSSSDDSYYVLGNASLSTTEILDAEDTGEPFMLVGVLDTLDYDKADNKVTIVTASMYKDASSGEEQPKVNVEICQPEEIVYNTLPNEFLPTIPAEKLGLDWIPTVEPFAENVFNYMLDGFSSTAISNVWMAYMTDFPDLIPGETYRVYFFGEPYLTIAQQAKVGNDQAQITVTVLGNVGLTEIEQEVDLGEYQFLHTDEPFCLARVAVKQSGKLTNVDRGYAFLSSHPRLINTGIWANKYNKIPQQYLPDDIVALPEKMETVMANGDKELILTSSTDGSSKQFRVTVDDTGSLTATEITT